MIVYALRATGPLYFTWDYGSSGMPWSSAVSDKKLNQFKVWNPYNRFPAPSRSTGSRWMPRERLHAGRCWAAGLVALIFTLICPLQESCRKHGCLKEINILRIGPEIEYRHRWLLRCVTLPPAGSGHGWIRPQRQVDKPRFPVAGGGPWTQGLREAT